MSFKEKGKIIGHVNIDGEMIPKYRGDTDVTLINTKTGKEYMSDAEADADVNDPNTATQREHIRRDVHVKVAQINIGADSKEL